MSNDSRQSRAMPTIIYVSRDIPDCPQPADMKPGDTWQSVHGDFRMRDDGSLVDLFAEAVQQVTFSYADHPDYRDEWRS